MSNLVELYCEQDGEGHWIVWFPHPLGGKDVLESFDNEVDALAFWKEQIDAQN